MDDAYKKIIAAYPPEKRAWDKTYPWIYFIARPVSFPVSWLFHKVGLTADGVTGITAVLGLAACIFFLMGQRACFIAGAACLLLYNFLDCVDGNLARAFPKAGAPVGKFWDQMVGNFYWLAYIFIGWGLGGALPFVLGAWITVERYVTQTVRHIFWSVLGGAWEQNKQAPEAGYKPHAGRWYYSLYYNLTDLQAHTFLLLVCAVFDKLFEFLLVSAVLAFFEFAVTLGFYLARSFRMRRAP